MLLPHDDDSEDDAPARSPLSIDRDNAGTAAVRKCSRFSDKPTAMIAAILACMCAFIGFALVGLVAHRQQQAAAMAMVDALPAWVAYARELRLAADRSVAPCDSLYTHSCNNMLRAIPADASAGAISDMHDWIQVSLGEIAQDGWPVVGAWYESCMNATGRYQYDSHALLPALFAVDAVRDAQSLAEAVAVLHAQFGVDTLFSVYVSADDLNLNLNSLYVDAPSAALPWPVGNSTRTALARVLGAKELEDALSVEFIYLQPYTLNASARRQGDADLSTYNLVANGQLHPDTVFNWTHYWLQTLGYVPAQAVSVQPAYLTHVAALLGGATDYAQWRAYLFYRLAVQYWWALPPPVSNLTISAYTCLQSVEDALGELLGHYYVSRAFPPHSKAMVNDMVERVAAAFAERLPDWLDSETREEALAKLAALVPMIGYPDRWDVTPVDYEVRADGDHLGNTVRAAADAVRRNLAQLGQPHNARHWLMQAYQVNAYYFAETIVFPAGILQGAFFNPAAPLEVNYGGIGVVIGHEITHAFDDQGARYDSKGLRRNWWSNYSATQFAQRAQCVVRMYNAFETPFGAVDGSLTLGENLADLGGLGAAYAAYEHAYADQVRHRAVQPAYEAAVAAVFGADMTRQRLFFRSFSYSWCSHTSDAVAAARLASDPHSPARWRVDGATSQSPQFREAYGCRAPSAECSVW